MRQSTWLNLIHILLTIGGVLFIYLVPFIGDYPVNGFILGMSAFLIILGQLIYLINIYIVFKHKRTKRVINKS